MHKTKIKGYYNLKARLFMISFLSFITLNAYSEPCFSFKFFDLIFSDDNTLYPAVENNNLKFRFGDGPDDMFTYSLKADIGFNVKLGILDYITYSSFLNVYTNNAYAAYHGLNNVESYRIDLFSHTIKAFGRYKQTYFFTGIHMILLGNYGGEFFQNNFHELVDLVKVNIPY